MVMRKNIDLLNEPLINDLVQKGIVSSKYPIYKQIYEHFKKVSKDKKYHAAIIDCAKKFPYSENYIEKIIVLMNK